MERIIVVLILGGAAIVQMPASVAQSGQIADHQSMSSLNRASGDISGLPPAPKGKSTILGGEIRDVDNVRDQFALKVFGQRPMKILFDERTQVFLDGKRIPVRTLRSGDHGSVQTVLDGTNVFALSIHMLTQSPKGEYQGTVLNYNPRTNELTVNAALSREPFKLIVPMNTPIIPVGQAGTSSPTRPGPADLVNGTLVSVEFESDKKGRGVASQIAILATPGSTFEFNGNLSSLDMHAGLLVLADPRDEKEYQISFDSSRMGMSENLHEGDQIKVTAIFDGTRYVASAITVN